MITGTASLKTADQTFPVLKTQVVSQQEANLSDRDRAAIEDILAWRTQPEFFKPGRTAWYQLRDPFRAETGVMVHAAKIKGAGGWNPGNGSELSAMRGSNPVGFSQPSNTEYAATVLRSHFGIAMDGSFCVVCSEPAPFGAITRKRAKLEYDNALHFQSAGIPAILPYSLVDYPDLALFRDEPLSAVVSFVPTPAPTRLEYFLFGGSHLTEAEREEARKLAAHFSDAPGQSADIDRARVNIALEVGELVRRMSASGRFRHSSNWDNFMFDPGGQNLFLTDLDSTQPLSGLALELRGLQQFRDLASALFRLAHSLYRHSIIRSHSFAAVREHDPFAAILSGYFRLPVDRCRELSEPIWRYYGTHWFLVDKMVEKMGPMPLDQKKSYNMDPDVFYCLVIWILADQFRRAHRDLNLEAIPETPTIERNIADFLGPRVELLKLMTTR